MKELQSLGMDVVVGQGRREIDMRQNFDDEETGFDMRDCRFRDCYQRE